MARLLTVLKLTVIFLGSCKSQYPGGSPPQVASDNSDRNVWKEKHDNDTSQDVRLLSRPTGRHNLLDNTTLISTWIDTQFGDVAANYATHNRIVNNVTLAMPHPGVYSAGTDPVNGILQPSDLAGLGEYTIRAGVVSPALNVMCVNMDPSELAPLVYGTYNKPPVLTGSKPASIFTLHKLTYP